MVVRSGERWDVEVRCVRGEVRGSHELLRETDVIYVRPVVRFFGRTVWRGEERVGYEFVHRWLNEELSQERRCEAA